MEKRVIVTMLVMMAFFMVVSYLYPILFPPPPEETKPQSPAAPAADILGLPAPPPVTVEGKAPEGAPASQAVPQDAESDIPFASFKDVTVETLDFIAVFTEEGGRLKSFQLKKYNTYKVDPDARDTFQELVRHPEGDTDYPLALSFWQNGVATDLKGLRFTADNYDLKVPEGGAATLTFTAKVPSGLQFVRTFHFESGSYLIRQELTLNNEGSSVFDGQMGMSLSSWPFSVQQNRYNVMAAFLNGKLYSDQVDDAKDELKEVGSLNSASFLGYMDQYFLTAFTFGGRAQGQPISESQDISYLRFDADELKGQGVLLSARYPLHVGPQGSAHFNFDFYYGPKSDSALAQAGSDLNRSVDLGWFTFLARPLGWLLKFFYGLVGNYGLAIILVTVLIKIVLWPLTAKSYRSMKDMQKIQPQIKKIRDKFKDDPQTMNKEIMQLYRTFKVNPLGSCLPMILQIPFFFAFYRVLDYSIELRGAPFMLWIQDLSAPDRLFHFAVSIPLLAPPTGLPVLTLLMGATMIWQQRMTPSMGDPMQAKIMMILPIVFIVALLNMPSGLVLYWLVNNILSIFQQKLINRPEKPKKEEEKPDTLEEKPPKVEEKPLKSEALPARSQDSPSKAKGKTKGSGKAKGAGKAKGSKAARGAGRA
ncbi:MAG: membrane protein insertase YidC [Deltaproteobacteria bacterium]|jgi:YidC/Oxa1 family membrane protein insertase|nr:membrane protein insertase YidC [Deltaproteobacteria bacterium]